MRSTIWLFALVLAACGDEGDPNDPNDPNGPNGPNGPSGSLDDLPNLFDAIEDPHACESAPMYNPEVATATTYFIGEFSFNAEGVVSGNEYWVLGANPYWVDRGGYDCVVVWHVSGTVEEPVKKGQYSLHLSASVDAEASDCTQDGLGNQVYVGYESFNVVYDVQTHDDGTATTYFSGSGNRLGSGHYNGGAVTFLSDMNCKFF